MGYDTSHIISVLAREGIEENSEIILLVPEIDERQRNSIDDIRNHVSNLDIEVRLSKFKLSSEFEQRFLQIQELLQNHSEVVMSLSGGSRDTLIPLTIASTVNQDSIDKTLFRSDIDSGLNEVEIPNIPTKLKKSGETVLNSLNYGQKLSAKEVKQETGKSDSSVYSNLEKLENKNLVNTTKENGVKKYSLSLTGKILST